jgi:hypothetical protein
MLNMPRKPPAITLDRNPDPNQKACPPWQPTLFSVLTEKPKITIVLVKKKKAKKRKPLDEKSKKRLDGFHEWKKGVEAGLCPHPEKKTALKDSEEYRNLSHQLEQVERHYISELGITLTFLQSYQNAKSIEKIAIGGLDELNLKGAQKLAGSVFLDAKHNSADDLRHAGELVTLVAILRDLNRIRSLLSRGEVVEPMRHYFVELPKKRRHNAKSACILLDDRELYKAARAYARKAEEIAGKKES